MMTTAPGTGDVSGSTQQQNLMKAAPGKPLSNH